MNKVFFLPVAVIKILQAVRNLKHKAMSKTGYAAGLRISENS